MEAAANGSNIDLLNDIRALATEIFEKTNIYIQANMERGVLSEILEPATVPVTEQIGSEIAVDSYDSDSVQQHFISSVVLRCMTQANGTQWVLESYSDYVNIRHLDEIGFSDCESHQLNYQCHKDIKIAMAENIDIVLLRTIMDWSRPEGNVWSQQIVWSGRFSDSRRMVQLMEGDSSSIKMRFEQFDIHRHLRDQYIALHGIYPVAAAISAVESSHSVIISEEHGDGEGLQCVICHDMLFTGELANQLRCGHIYHKNCIREWYYSRLICPLCRDELH